MRVRTSFRLATFASTYSACVVLTGCASSAGAPEPSTSPRDDDAGATEAPEVLTYPAGPYGKTTGRIIPNFHWTGYRNGVGPLIDIALLDYYDPHGRRGIRAIVLDMSGLWCGSCNSEAAALSKTYDDRYRSRGAQFITTMTDDAEMTPATQQTVDKWIAMYHCPYDVVLDPAAVLQPPGIVGLPYHVVVDPRTMKIVTTTSGDATAVDAAVSALLVANGGEALPPQSPPAF